MTSALESLRRRWRRVRQFWIDHIWLPVATTVVGIAGLVAVLNLAPTRPDPANPGQTEIYGWGSLGAFVAAVMIALGLASLLLTYRSGESRADRIKRLTTALDESMRIIAEINSEMA